VSSPAAPSRTGAERPADGRVRAIERLARAAPPERRVACDATAAPPPTRPPQPSGSGALPLWAAVAQAAALVGGLLLSGFVITAILAGAGILQAGACDAPGGVGGTDVPQSLVPIYTQAAARYGLGARGPAVLAAINWIETDFGRDLAMSSAGAVGFMQFMPSTWATYGVDANGDGSADPRDPWDAIFAAASDLRANGAPGDWNRAVFAYNHAGWYVQKVLARADGYQRAAPSTAAVCAAPATGRLAKLIAEANRIDALRSDYLYGGGHVTPAPATPPWDCSSAWSRLLQVAGYAIPTMTSTGFMAWGDPGPGRHVTIYATPAHVYGTIDGRAWGTGANNPRDPGGGPAWLPYTTNPVPGFPGGTPTVRHPPGL
jgi:soluble lytic murein transglycosylase-like protein